MTFVSSSRLNEKAPSLGSKYYQLEEMEDKESCTTELFLSSDGSVSVGVTNGPLPIEASGKWEKLSKDGTFKMTITRTYSTGMKNKGDLGEFQFSVPRSFIGTVSNIGGSIGVTGSMHLLVSTLAFTTFAESNYIAHVNNHFSSRTKYLGMFRLAIFL